MQLGLHASKEINANIRRLINSCAAEPASMGLLHVLCLRAGAVIIAGTGVTRPPNILVGGSKGKFPPPTDCPFSKGTCLAHSKMLT